LTRGFEVENANRADLVLCTTDREARKLRRLGVAQPIYASHLIVPRGDFAEPVHREKLGEGICFHGKHRYPPNADALARLWRWCQRDDALRRRLTVIGTIDNRMRARFPGVNFTGYVDSLAQTLATHRLSIAPLRVSVGLPTKAVEAIYAGLPVLVTPAVYGGLPNARHYRNQCVFVATLDQFAGALDALYSNEVALQNAGRRLAEYRRDLIDSAHDGLCQALMTLKLLPVSIESSTDLVSAAQA
jgi:glycosyltransferase involved in cell wall biosynthesis